MATASASSFLPSRESPVKTGMNESEAGEAITGYMERVQDATGVSAEDIDVFDGDRNWEGAAERIQQPEEDENGKSEEDASASPSDASDDESASGSADSEGEDDGEPDAASASDEDASADVQAELEASQIAEILGVDEDTLVVTDDGAIQLRYRVDGQDGTATPSDLLTSYQLRSAIDRKSALLDQEAQQLREATLRREQELQQAVVEARAFQKAMEDRITARYAEVDWNALRASDPGKAALLQTDMATELQAVRGEAAKVLEGYQQEFARSQQMNQQQQQQWMAEQQKLLFHHLPDLADEAKRPGILSQYQEYLVSYGFSPEEVRNIHDHRYLRVIADAVANSQRAEEKKEEPKALVKKRLLKVPRVARGGARRSEGDDRKDRKQAALKRLQRTGSDDDAARLMVESGVADAVLGE